MDNFIKKTLPALIVIFYFIGVATAQKKFVRVYPAGPAKVVKGYYAGHTDSAIIIESNHRRVALSYLKIQNIHTAKTVGHNILIGSVTGGLVGAIVGLATLKDTRPVIGNFSIEITQAQHAAIGFIVGAMAGTAVGAISGADKKKENLTVAGDFANRKTILARLDEWPVYNNKTTSK